MLTFLTERGAAMWLLRVDKLTDHTGEHGNPSLPGPAKNISSKQAPHNAFSFLIKADGRYTKY